MKAVVDTNVVAYLLLGTEGFIDEARTCLTTVSHPLAPAHWEAELTNVLWMAVRAGVLPPAEGPVRLSLAASGALPVLFRLVPRYSDAPADGARWGRRAAVGRRVPPAAHSA